MAGITAIVSTAISVGGAVMNFSQAAKQGELQRQAEIDGEKAYAEADAKLEENFYKGRDINLKSFEQERNAIAGLGDRLVTAGQEGERGAGAIAGRVMLGAQKAEQDITKRQIDSLENLEQLVAGEESRLRDGKVNLALAQAEGAQIAASDAAKNRAAANQSAIQGLGAAGVGLMESQKNLADPKLFGETEFGKLFKGLFSGVSGADANANAGVVDTTTGRQLL